MSSNVTAPAGMSRADALKGLWECSSPAAVFQNIPKEVLKARATDFWKSKEKVEKTIQEHPHIEYFGDRCIKTDLSKYPEIDLAFYQRYCNKAMSFAEIFERCLKQPVRNDLH